MTRTCSRSYEQPVLKKCLFRSRSRQPASSIQRLLFVKGPYRATAERNNIICNKGIWRKLLSTSKVVLFFSPRRFPHHHYAAYNQSVTLNTAAHTCTPVDSMLSVSASDLASLNRYHKTPRAKGHSPRRRICAVLDFRAKTCSCRLVKLNMS